MKRTSILLLCLMMLAACQHEPEINLAAETEALMAADIAFAELSEATTPKQAFAAFMAPDGMMLPRGSEGAIKGPENIAALFGPDGDPGYQLLWQPQFAEVAAAGDMGWTWGQYQVVAGGEPTSSGKYVNVWKRQPDGSWKVRVDVGNQRPGPGSP